MLHTRTHLLRPRYAGYHQRCLQALQSRSGGMGPYCRRKGRLDTLDPVCWKKKKNNNNNFTACVVPDHRTVRGRLFRQRRPRSLRASWAQVGQHALGETRRTYRRGFLCGALAPAGPVLVVPVPAFVAPCKSEHAGQAGDRQACRAGAGPAQQSARPLAPFANPQGSPRDTVPRIKQAYV